MLLNVTVVAPDGDGYVTVYPCGADRPNASNVNYKAGQTIANSVVANVGGNGQVCIYSYANAYVLVDVAGTLG
ncbi:MAG: hypothetical protein R2705_24795 [Ilumatobacteraceae bacterium]